MEKKRDDMLREIMACDFTLVDLNLYLNTHPGDVRAIYIFNNQAMKAKMLRDQYERMYGPLTPMSPSNPSRWQWIESPWPWECGRMD